ncbi:MAG TPA: Flp family type IVb pilin [Desulfuromonadaceae bacterium]
MRNLIAMYIAMQSRMQSMLKDEKGATMVEYALMVALIAVVCIGAVTAMGVGVEGRFAAITAAL